MAALSPVPADAALDPGVRPTWGLGDAAVGWAAAQVSGAVLGSAIVLLCGYSLAEAQAGTLPLWVLALQYPTLWIGFVGVPLWAARAKGNGIVRDFGFRVRPLDIPIGLAIGIAAQVVMVPLVSWPFLKLAHTTADKLGEPARILGNKATTPTGVVLLFLMAGIGAPIAEELFFRGLVLRSFQNRFATGLAILFTSIAFAATHFEALQFPALAVAGAIFALLAVRTGRLGPAIAAHMGFNLIAVAALVWHWRWL